MKGKVCTSMYERRRFSAGEESRRGQRLAVRQALARIREQPSFIEDVDVSPQVRDGAVGAQLVEPDRYGVARSADDLCKRFVRDLQRRLAGLVGHHQQPPREPL